MKQLDKSAKIITADDKTVVMQFDDIDNLDFFFPIDGSMFQDVQPANKETHKWTLIEILQKIGNNYEIWSEPDEGLYIYDGGSVVVNPICKTEIMKPQLTGNILYVGDLDHIELEVVYNSMSCRRLREDMLSSKEDFHFFFDGEDVSNYEEIFPMNVHLKGEEVYTPEELTALCHGAPYITIPLPELVPGNTKMMVFSETPGEGDFYFNVIASVIARKAIDGPAAMISTEHFKNI